MENRIVLCTVASNDYLIYLERLLSSAQLFLPNELFFVVLVNVDKLKVTYLKSLYQNVIFSHDYVGFRSIAEQRGYCTNRRSALFLELMEKFSCPIIWIDVDSLFINDAYGLVAYAEQYDLSVFIDQEHRTLKLDPKRLKQLPKGPLGTPYYGVFSNGVIITNNSQRAKELFKDFAERVGKHPLAWYSDQEGLYLSYLKFKDKITFQPLDLKYCSTEKKADYIIWTVKGDLKSRDEYFLLGEKYISDQRKWPQKRLEASESTTYLTHEEVSTASRIKKVLRKIKNIVKASMH